LTKRWTDSGKNWIKNEPLFPMDVVQIKFFLYKAKNRYFETFVGGLLPTFYTGIISQLLFTSTPWLDNLIEKFKKHISLCQRLPPLFRLCEQEFILLRARQGEF